MTIRIEPSSLPEAQMLKLDISKARALLGWAPALDFAQTVGLTMEWYRASDEEPAVIASVTDRQIDDYVQSVAAAP